MVLQCFKVVFIRIRLTCIIFTTLIIDFFSLLICKRLFSRVSPILAPLPPPPPPRPILFLSGYKTYSPPPPPPPPATANEPQEDYDVIGRGGGGVRGKTHFSSEALLYTYMLISLCECLSRIHFS